MQFLIHNCYVEFKLVQDVLCRENTAGTVSFSLLLITFLSFCIDLKNVSFL